MENDYKKMLQERTFEPSKDSWKTLDEKLTAFENKRKAKKWQFFKYAASILLMVSVGVYFIQTKEQKEKSIIVEQPIIKIKELHKDFSNSEPKEVVTEVIKEAELKPSIKKTLIVNTEVLKKENKLKTNKKILINPKGGIIVGEISSNFKIYTIKTKTIKEFVVLAQNIEKKNGKVSDAEIELLLEQAYKSLIVERKNIKKVSFKGADLLAEIEYDLDKDFKARLFEAIVNTLKDPKKVFVNRDN
jgi:hypothetical protein